MFRSAKGNPSKTFSSLATRKVMSFRCDTACEGDPHPPVVSSQLTCTRLPTPSRPFQGWGVDGFLFHFSFAPRLIQLHRSYVLFLIKAYASRRRRSSPLGGGGYIRGGVDDFSMGRKSSLIFLRENCVLFSSSRCLS